MRTKSAILHRIKVGLSLKDDEIVWLRNWTKMEKDRMRIQENFMFIAALILFVLSLASALVPC